MRSTGYVSYTTSIFSPTPPPTSSICAVPVCIYEKAVGLGFQQCLQMFEQFIFIVRFIVGLCVCNSDLFDMFLIFMLLR
jgi:hypothetical protein